VPSAALEHYYLAWSDVQQVAPGALGPSGYQELAPNSGTWVPNPGTNRLQPGWAPANRMPEDAVDLSTMQRLAPGALGPYGCKELVPGSGVWFADSRIHGPGEKITPKKPLDLNDIQRFPPGALGPHFAVELAPGSGVWVPDPNYSDPPKVTKPSAYHSDTGDAGHTPADKPYEVEYAKVEKFAGEHDDNAQQLAEYAKHDPDFAERYLATHGMVNYPTYLKIKDYMAGHVEAVNAYADRQSETADKLRGYVTTVSGLDNAAAAAVTHAAQGVQQA
jgi:hypothetical protein